MIEHRTATLTARLNVMSAARRWRWILLALMAPLAAATPGQAQQFSAELMRTADGSTTSAGQLHVSGDKVRIESPDFPDGFFLIDGAKPAAYFVRPAPHLFMDARQSTVLTRLFVPVDADNPCRQWQKMAEVAGLEGQGEWRCEVVGAESIGGREARAYRATPAAGHAFTGWIDGVRKFPLRIKTDDGTVIAATSIRDERQAADLFELPQGARKFDPAALIEQIKQSDVWVAAPQPAP
ncbi:MAG TPA: hypothetical protein VKY22_07980 [Bradyrhizobium sp.]|nr:hypothetical protein [Bradyrhizobium sp.]